MKTRIRCRYVYCIDPVASRKGGSDLAIEMELPEDLAFDAMTEIFANLTTDQFETWMREQAPEFLKESA